MMLRPSAAPRGPGGADTRRINSGRVVVPTSSCHVVSNVPDQLTCRISYRKSADTSGTYWSLSAPLRSVSKSPAPLDSRMARARRRVRHVDGGSASAAGNRTLRLSRSAGSSRQGLTCVRWSPAPRRCARAPESRDAGCGGAGSSNGDATECCATSAETSPAQSGVLPCRSAARPPATRCRMGAI